MKSMLKLQKHENERMNYYVVIDTNVIVSALLKWDSVPGCLLELTFEGKITPVLNFAILAEYKNVLSRDKFGFTEDIVDDIIRSIEMSAIFVDEEKKEINLPDEKDKMFYEVVMEKRKNENAYLVTGNIKHFPKKPFIVTPRQMLEIILKDFDLRE